MRLIIARHAQPAVDPSMPPGAWRLSPEGRRSALRLALRPAWAGVARIHHSPQPKATRSPRSWGRRWAFPWRPHRTCGRFPGAGRIRGVGGPVPGAGQGDARAEPYAAAQARFVACLRAIIAGAAGGSVAIVSHGRILTVLFSALTGQRLGAADWRSIGLPDLAVVDLDAGRVAAGFFAGRPVRREVLLGD